MARKAVKGRAGRHHSMHPWEAAWNGHSPHRNRQVLPDREKLGIGGSGPCRTLKDMSPEEIAAIEREYGAKVVIE